MKTGFYGISDTLDTMMGNRIYGKNTVDAVLQDNAVILEESNASFLYRKPLLHPKWKFSFQWRMKQMRKPTLPRIIFSGADRRKC